MIVLGYYYLFIVSLLVDFVMLCILMLQIPVYAFDKALQSNANIMQLFLGHNPWRCDCHFIPRFQSLLLKYKRIIRDFADVRCSKSDDKILSLVQVSTMEI